MFLAVAHPTASRLSLAVVVTASLALAPVAHATWVDVTVAPLGNAGNGLGVAWLDFDDDGDLDLFLANNGAADKLFRNDGGTFVDTGDLGDAGAGSGVACGDYDDDGDLDIYLSRAASSVNRLYTNLLPGWTNAAGPAGVDNGNTGRGVAWGDVDGDGDLDLYLANGDANNRLYINNGDGTFSNLGYLADPGSGRGVCFGDVDNDGDLDLYLVNNGSANRLFRNDGPGLWVDVASGSLADAGAGFGAAFGDIDNDGDLDLYLSNHLQPNKLFRNDGGGVFTDVSAAPVNDAGAGRGVAFGDVDNDGDLDLYLVNDGSANRLFLNDGAGTFTLAAASPLDDAGTGNGVAFGDYDNDGDLDLYLAKDGPNKLFRNDGVAAGNRWLNVNLVGPSSGIGARIRVVAGGVSRIQEVSAGSGYLSQNSLTAEFGLGSATVVDSVIVHWPRGPRSAYTGVAANQTIALSPFNAAGVALPGLINSSVAWGDYDNDGDLDIALSGWTGSQRFTHVYRNGGGSFTLAASLPGVSEGQVAWGDYDNDGDLDLLASGYTDAATGGTFLYRNDGGGFTDVGAGLPGVYFSSVAWGDYDNDGDLDILLTGFTGSSGISRIYRNRGGANPTFYDISAAIAGVYYGSVAWGDYDKDGDLDILLTGFTGSSGISKIYRNRGGEDPTFNDINAAIAGVYGGSVAWGDYDNDGDLDILLSGYTGSSIISRIYGSNGAANPAFTDIGAGLPGVRYGSAAWGDYDNDGDLDVLLTGSTGTTVLSRVYENAAGSFLEYKAGLTGVASTTAAARSAAWGDYDNDGDLDVLLAGDTGAEFVTLLYRNHILTPNTPPAPPSNLAYTRTDNVVTFTWDAATDAQTPGSGLTYSLRVGRTPGGGEFFSAMADPATGYRRLPALGNVNHRRQWTLRLPASLPAEAYWSVQAVDAAFAGSTPAPGPSIPFPFNDVGAGLPGVQYASVAWGDYDNDGDLDILLTGLDAGDSPISRIYRNSGGVNPTFGDIGAGLPGVQSGSAAWGDYDNDGDLDILLTGLDVSETPISRIYRNSGGVDPTFADIGAELPGVYVSSVAWGDYDNDGDLDILIAGITTSAAISRIYRSSGGVNPTFTELGAGLHGVYSGSVAWGDYDNDGDLDLLLTGTDFSDNPISRIYRNSGGVDPTFTDIGAGLPGVYASSVAWGDYDSDGDLDILLTGSTGGAAISSIYRNDGGANPTFADVGAGLPGVWVSSVAWGDHDNDGALDILIAGLNVSGTAKISRIYRNSGEANPTFTDIGAGLPGVLGGSVAWGDFDNDGDLDILFTGQEGTGLGSRVFRSNVMVANTPPGAPTNPSVAVAGNSVTFGWDAATDAQTPAAGLTYNLRVGTTPGAGDVFSGMADPATGYRRLPAVGNVNHNTSWTLELPGPSPPVVYWSVQAVDGAFAGSAFTPVMATVDAPPSGQPPPTEFRLHASLPNPMFTRTTIGFDLPRAAAVSLRIYDAGGRLATTLHDREELPAGRHRATWDGLGRNRSRLGPGVYWIEMTAPGFRGVRKLVLLQ